MRKQMQLFEEATRVFDICNKVLYDLRRRRFDFYIVASFFLSVLALESPNMILFPYMVVAQVILTVPFAIELWRVMTDTEERHHTRMFLLNTLAWISLRFTWAFLSVGDKPYLCYCLLVLMLLQSLTLVQVQMGMIFQRLDYTRFSSALAACLLLPLILIISTDPLVLAAAITSSYLVLMIVCLTNYSSPTGSKIWEGSKYQSYILLSLFLGSCVYMSIWQDYQTCALHPLLIVLTLVISVCRTLPYTVPGIAISCLVCFLSACLLCSWSCLWVPILVMQCFVS